MLLEHFDKRFANCLRHLSRRTAYIHDTVLVRECVVYLGALLSNQVLNVDFLALHEVSHKSMMYEWGRKEEDIPDPY
jgi:hypothetical protein